MDDKLVGFLALLSVFLLGAALATVVLAVGPTPIIEQPFRYQGPIEKASPSDTIGEDQIKVYKNGVQVALEDPTSAEWLITLPLDDPSWSTFTDTNSMDPVFDQGANTIRIKVDPETLAVGDIVSYRYTDGSIIIHRIVHIDHDEVGLYFVLKGDNNPASDPLKVRPDQVLGKVVAIFY
jgi:signal peptidase I